MTSNWMRIRSSFFAKTVQMNAVDVKEQSGAIWRHKMHFCHEIQPFFVLASFGSDGERADGIDQQIQSGAGRRVEIETDWRLVFVFDLEWKKLIFIIRELLSLMHF